VSVEGDEAGEGSGTSSPAAAAAPSSPESASSQTATTSVVALELSGAEEIMISGQVEPGAATHIVGLSLTHGRFDAAPDAELPTFGIDDDGSFAVPLARDGRDWMLAVVDQDQGAFLGFLTFPVDAKETLIVLPIRMLKDDIDLGDVELGNDEALTSKGVGDNTESLVWAFERLAERAALDDVAIQAKARLRLASGPGVPHYEPTFAYAFAALPIASIIGDWSSPDPLEDGAPVSTALSVRTSEDAATNALCRGSQPARTETPVVGERLLTFTSCQAANGHWDIVVDGERRASFDVTAAAPLSADGNARVYVPSVRIVPDPQSKTVQRLEIQWFYYDRSLPEGPAYRPADPEAFRQTVGDYRVTWSDARHPRPLVWSSPVEDIDFDPHVWSVLPKAAPALTLSYAFAGATYSWSWSAVTPPVR
jgi:hypothetical protein